MFATITEGVELYRSELVEYKKWTDALEERIGTHLDTITFWGRVGRQDYRKVHEWNAKLKGMEQALGLTASEVLQIESEVGIEHVEEATSV